MDTHIEGAVQAIAADNRSGAAEILNRAAEVFSLLAAPEETFANIEDARRAVIEICAALIRAQPAMAPLANLAGHVAAAVQAVTQPAEAANAAREAAADYRDRVARAVADTVSRAAALIAQNVTLLTHSRSSTALAALLAARRAGRSFHVIAAESRPLFEGRALARELLAEGVEVTLIADAAAALVMERVDFVLVGADKVTPDALFNKIGTRMVALAARERGVRVYSVCDTSKFINPAGLTAIEESHSADELWPDAPAGVQVVNRYFEPTPLALFTGIITEDGILAPAEAARRAQTSSINPALIRAIQFSAPAGE
ncbi:MAG TPA: hypothetical protein VNO70_26825 [Blastocatellia bacterium]|nr:hypothetical protein [Blastocatellia bacterium]